MTTQPLHASPVDHELGTAQPQLFVPLYAFILGEIQNLTKREPIHVSYLKQTHTKKQTTY
jgi:hypothetical protein